jgi:nitrogen fixation NifU-like protein
MIKQFYTITFATILKIIDAKFKTFGCGSAIASSSLATEWLIGKEIENAGQITNKEIAAKLSLPPVKIHCSLLAEEAIQAAIADYKKKNTSDSEEDQEESDSNKNS